MANNAQAPEPQPQPQPQPPRRGVSRHFPFKYTLSINADYLPVLSRNYVIRVLPDGNEDAEKRQLKFLSHVKSDQPDPDPVKEEAKQDKIFEEHVKRIKIIKANLSRAKESRDKGDVEYISPVQRISVFCNCENHDGESGLCPRVDAMRVVRYESSDGDEGEDNGGNDGGDDNDNDDEPPNKRVCKKDSDDDSDE